MRLSLGCINQWGEQQVHSLHWRSFKKILFPIFSNLSQSALLRTHFFRRYRNLSLIHVLKFKLLPQTECQSWNIQFIPRDAFRACKQVRAQIRETWHRAMPQCHNLRDRGDSNSNSATLTLSAVSTTRKNPNTSVSNNNKNEHLTISALK